MFLNLKPVEILITLGREERMHSKEISEKADVTYSHSVRILDRMEKEDLVVSERVGRKKEFALTQKGSDLAMSFMEMYGLVRGENTQEARVAKAAL